MAGLQRMARSSKRMRSTTLFPMFLKLSARPCLVLGAGTIAESKIAGLLEAGGRVRVVAPEATPQVRSWAQSNSIEWHQRSFQPDDLTGMFLVVAATSSEELHQRIFEEATRRGVLCNIVDVPVLCDFYYPAVVQRGALQIAISTAGKSPALAQRLRKQLEERSEEHTSELQSPDHLVCRLLLEKKKNRKIVNDVTRDSKRTFISEVEHS